MGFQISPLQRERFDRLFDMSEEALAGLGAMQYVADRKPGFPCRVSLRDAEPGERVILVPFEHQDAASPYRASGPIFVREGAADARVPPDAVPDVLRTRLLSVRAYDGAHLMIG